MSDQRPQIDNNTVKIIIGGIIGIIAIVAAVMVIIQFIDPQNEHNLIFIASLGGLVAAPITALIALLRVHENGKTLEANQQEIKEKISELQTPSAIEQRQEEILKNQRDILDKLDKKDQ